MFENFDRSQTPRTIDSATIDKIVALAITTVDKYGSGRNDAMFDGVELPTCKSGSFLVRNHETSGLEPGFVSILSIDLPVGRLAEKSLWKVSLASKVDGTESSKFMLIEKDYTIRVFDGSDDPDQYLSDQGAAELSEKLSKLYREIADDHISLFTELR